MNVFVEGQFSDEFSIVALFNYGDQFLVAVLESYQAKLAVSIELSKADRAQRKRFLVSFSY